MVIEKHNLLLTLGQTLDVLRQEKIQLQSDITDLGDTPYQHTLSRHSSNTPYQHTLVTHPINTPYQVTLVTHPINTP